MPEFILQLNRYEIVSAVIGILLYIPMCLKIARGQIRQSFATWLLWALLDVIVTASIWWNEGSYLLPLAYTLGSAITAVVIFRARMFYWTWFESLVSSLAVVCMVIWYFTNAEVATVASTMAVSIACFPTFRDAYRKPEHQPLWLWVGFLFTNALGVVAGNAWTIKERLYPTSGVVMGCIIVILSARRPTRVAEALP